MANVVVVASISPLKAEISRPQFIPVDTADASKGGNYRLPPAEKGKVETLRIGDANERYMAPVTHFAMTNTITAAEIARDLVIHSTENAPFMSPDCHPGVWACAGLEPTAEEIAEAHRVQSAYAAAILNWGNELASQPETVKLISEQMRIWAKWLGREPVWLNPPSDLDFMDCPYCRKPTARAGAVCGNCHQITNPQRYAELKRIEKEAQKALNAA